MRAAGFAELAMGLHSLKEGGATAYAAAEKGGLLIPTAMGGWSSESYRRYIWVSQEQLCQASLEIGRSRGPNIADRLRPFSSR